MRIFHLDLSQMGRRAFCLSRRSFFDLFLDLLEGFSAVVSFLVSCFVLELNICVSAVLLTG